MRKRILASLVLAGSLIATAVAQQSQSPLVAARELYGAARYDEALAMLNELRPSGSGNPAELKAVEQYRSLCLLALGRATEAETAIAAVVTADPTYQPSEAEASPRVRAAFSDVRRRLLPEIARSSYAAAKAAYDRKDFAAAEAQFRALLALLDDPEMGGRQGDLRVLVSGFVDLATAAAAPPPEPKHEEPPPPPVAPAPVAAPPLPVNRIYTGEEPGIVPPVAIKQDVPRVPMQITSQARERGILEVVIDEQGRVASLNLRTPIHPMYDAMLISAARDWQYHPAALNGKPVKFRKMMQISLTRR